MRPRSRTAALMVLGSLIATSFGGCSEAPTPTPESSDSFEIIAPDIEADTGSGVDAASGDAANTDDTATPPPMLGPIASPWPMEGQTYQNTHRSEYVGARVPETAWSISVGSKIGGQPVLAQNGDIVFGARDNNVYVYSPDGEQKLVYSAAAPIDASPSIGADGAIYFGCFDGKLYALESNGVLRWTYETGGAINTAPILTPEGAIVFGSRDKSLYSLHPDGSLQWKFTTDGAIEGTVAIARDGTIYAGSADNYLYAIDPATGAEKWRFETEGEVVASPLVLENDVIVIGSKFGLLANVFALNPDGSVLWKKRLEGGVEAAAAEGPTGTVYIGTLDGDVFALKPDNGNVEWSTPTGAAIQAAPLVDAQGVLFVGSFDTLFYALEPSNGDIRWNTETGGLVWNGAIIADTGALYVTSDNTLIAFAGGGDCEGTPIDCSDGDICTVDRCDDELGCVNEPLCDDGNPCTDDTCDGPGECIFTPAAEGDSCDDGFACTSGETCQAGLCQAATNQCGPADSPWPMRGGNAQRTALSPWPATQSGSIVWEVELGRPVSSSPVLGSDDTVYVSLSNTPQDESGAVVAIKDGQIVFDTILPNQVTSTPAVTDFGTLYVGCKDTFFYALDSVGSIEWQYKSGWVRSSPVITDDGTI